MERGPISWSNELVRHVVELKTTKPARDLWSQVENFQTNIRDINNHLKNEGAQLLSTGMHPFMDPAKETQLWPHGCNDIYRAFDNLFNCRGHGWSNLQSVHLNLPFSNDEEFYRLHNAIRLLLPLIPSLTASSPIVEGKVASTLDTRLEYYRNNCRRIPLITGMVVPEPVKSRLDYEQKILQHIYAALPETAEILKHEWVNARGAIARFERNTIEIRVIDTQECPSMDVAILCFLRAILQALVNEHWTPTDSQYSLPTENLSKIFLKSLIDGDQTIVNDRDYLSAFGLPDKPHSTGEILLHLFGELSPKEGNKEWCSNIDYILKIGCLSRRIIKALGGKADKESILSVYKRIAHCLHTGSKF